MKRFYPIYIALVFRFNLDHNAG